MATWRYGVALGGILAALGGAAYLAFESITAGDVAASRAAADSATADSARAIARATTIEPPAPVTPPVRVTTDTAPPPAVRSDAPPLPAPWRPSPEQVFRDSLFRLTQGGRDADAVRLLDAWLAAHPADRDARLESARLRLRTGDRAGAWQAYERVLSDGRGTDVLAEYAAALLASGEHARAAQRYDELLRRDPSRHDWRLGAARARAWGGQPREALALLRDVPEDGSELATLRADLRRQIEPTSDEAHAWLAQHPADTLAQLALARALVREGRAPEALAAYDRLLVDAPSARRFAEAAGVAAGIPDSLAAARYLRGAVALAPTDTLLRRRYREALAWSGDRAGAIAQLDTLIAREPTAALHLERARLRSWSGDVPGAQADAEASVTMSPNAEAYALLGDLHRWQGQRPEARSAYRLGLVQDPTSVPAQQGLAELHRTRYRDLPWDPDEGVGAFLRTVNDNEGFGSQVGRVTAGMALGEERRTVVVAAAEVRRLDHDSANANMTGGVTGAGGEVGIAQRLDRLRVSGRVGALGFDGVKTIVTGAVSVDGPVGSGRWTAEAARLPAYERLRSSRTLVTGPATATPVTAVMGAASLNVPLSSRLELWSRGEVLGLSDDNLRASVQASLRLGIVPSVSALYAGGLLTFADSSLAYWSPTYYTLQSLGLEYRHQWPGGWYASGQGLAGYAWYEERLTGGRVQNSAFQWSVTGELGWRATRWDVGAWTAFGSDRSGNYRAVSTALRARYRW